MRLFLVSVESDECGIIRRVVAIHLQCDLSYAEFSSNSCWCAKNYRDWGG